MAERVKIAFTDECDTLKERKGYFFAKKLYHFL